jgi:hypothetical protein
MLNYNLNLLKKKEKKKKKYDKGSYHVRLEKKIRVMQTSIPCHIRV